MSSRIIITILNAVSFFLKKFILKFFNWIDKKAHKIHIWRLKSKIHKVGENVYFFGQISIVEPQNLTIGSNCSLNHGVYINAFNPIVIGNDVTLSAHCMIVSTGIDIQGWVNHDKRHLKDKSIYIGDHVWIGANAVILPGVHITGNYVVIAAGAIVTKNITDSNTIWGGCLVA